MRRKARTRGMKIQEILGVRNYQDLPLSAFPPMEELRPFAQYGGQLGRLALREIVAPYDLWRDHQAVFARHAEPRALSIRAEVLRRGLKAQMEQIRSDAETHVPPVPFAAIDTAIEEERPYIDARGLLVRGNNPLREHGVNTHYVQFEQLVENLIEGVPTEYEGPGIYAINHVDETGSYKFREEKLTPDDRTSIVVARYLSRVLRLLRDTRLTCLGDDLTTYSQEIDRFAQFKFQERVQFAVDQVRYLTQQGLLHPGDTLGSEAIIYSEAGLRENNLYITDGAAIAAELTHRLYRGTVIDPSEAHDKSERVVKKSLRLSSETIRNLNLPRKNLKGAIETGPDVIDSLVRNGVPLFYNSGKASCPLADASRYGSIRDSEIMKIVPIGRSYTSQQHQVAAILSSAGLDAPDQYHNIFFDSAKNPHGITYGVLGMMHKAVKEYQYQSDSEQRLSKLGSAEQIAMGLRSHALKEVRSIR